MMQQLLQFLFFAFIVAPWLFVCVLIGVLRKEIDAVVEKSRDKK